MKIKYFLRGLGMGIIFSAVLILATGGTKKQALTNEEIIARASLLGMVMPEDSTLSEESASPSESDEPMESSEPLESEEPKESSEPEETPKTSAEPSTEEEEETTKTEEEAQSAKTEEYVTVRISQGMWSKDVANAMEAAGLVSNAESFDEYLCDNGYASLISTGTYQIPAGADFYEIANKITK
jgi:hypothetical protein